MLLLLLPVGLKAQPNPPDTLIQHNGPSAVQNDSSGYVTLDSVLFAGLERTRERYLVRELNVRIGDSIRLADLPKVLERNQQLIYNTNLFNKVELSYELDGRSLKLRFVVAERWYIWPELYLKTEERTIIEWLQRPSLNRTTYGGGVTFNNFTGRNDKLALRVTAGFSRRYSFGYARPFLIPEKLIGLRTGLTYGENDELIYATREGKPLRIRETGAALQRTLVVEAGLEKRFSQNHGIVVTAGWHSLRIRGGVLDSTAVYLSSPGRTYDQYASLEVEFWYDSRDVRAFPLRGRRFQAIVGLNGYEGLSTTRFLTFQAKYFRYHPLGQRTRWYTAFGAQVLWLTGRNVPYPEKFYLNQANVRGFDTYVVDASFVATARSELRYAVVERKIVSWQKLPRQFRDFPFGIYPFAFLDIGIAQDATYNNLDPTYKNRALIGYGVGLDVPYFYDNVLRIEAVQNNFGRFGFLLNLSVALR